jgi:hypothetical protein
VLRRRIETPERASDLNKKNGEIHSMNVRIAPTFRDMMIVNRKVKKNTHTVNLILK